MAVLSKINKQPKEIYVPDGSVEPIFFTSPEECARKDETVVLRVYRLVGTVEVSTQIKQEIVVKKRAPKRAAKKKPDMPAESDPMSVSENRHPLLEELRVTGDLLRS